MRHIFTSAVVLAACAFATPALAADDAAPAPAFKISGSAVFASDYRLRGVSQSDKGFTTQGNLTLAHESGLYASIFSSNLSGWGTFGGPNIEFDLIGGFKKTLGTATFDVGLTWYMYPGGANKTDFAEPYFKVSGTVGPVSLLGGVAYAPSQQALGEWYFSGADYATGVPNQPFKKNDNVYLWGDLAAAVPTTPLTLKAHIGYSKGNPGLGPNGTSVAPTGSYWDYLFGVDYAVYGPIVLSVNFAGTDIKAADALYLQPNFSKVADGSSISKGKVFFAITAAF